MIAKLRPRGGREGFLYHHVKVLSSPNISLEEQSASQPCSSRTLQKDADRHPPPTSYAQVQKEHKFFTQEEYHTNTA